MAAPSLLKRTIESEYKEGMAGPAHKDPQAARRVPREERLRVTAARDGKEMRRVLDRERVDLIVLTS
jgi:hypothetical protein